MTIKLTCNQQALIDLARSGAPRPLKGHPLYNTVKNLRQHFPDLWQTFLEVRPEWGLPAPKGRKAVPKKVRPRPKTSGPTLTRSIDQWVDRDPSAALWSPPVARNAFRGVPGLGLIVDLWRAGRPIPPGPLEDCLRNTLDHQCPRYDHDFRALVEAEAPWLLTNAIERARSRQGPQ